MNLTTTFVVVDDNLNDLWNHARDAWLDAKRRRSGRENTASAYATAHRQFSEWSPAALWEVTPTLAEDWARELQDRLAPASVNSRLAAMTSFYDYVRRRPVSGPAGRELLLWPVERPNPFGDVERAHVDPYGRACFPSTAELRAILASINVNCLSGARDFSLLLAFAVTCRRASELLELRWGDIQATSATSAGYEYIYTARKRGSSDRRRATLDPEVYQAIRRYLEMAGRWRPARGEYIWTALDPERIRRIDPDAEIVENRPLHNTTANGILKTYAARAGVDEAKAHLHALRHAGARLRVEQQKANGGVDYLELMELLNHSGLDVTQTYVQRLLEEPADPGGRRAAAVLLGKVQPQA